jgi:hypothetical protein
MKNLLFFCFAILAASCCKKTAEAPAPSPCLTAKLEEFKQQSDAVSIRTQSVSGETHYWLNTDARAYDGLEYILGENCDTVCSIGGFRLPLACESDYDFEDWEIIWQQ